MLNSNLNATLPQRRGSGTIDPSEPREGTASSSTQDTRDAPRPTTPVPPALQGLVGGAPPPQRAPITGAGPAGAARTETPLATLEAWVAAAPADEDRAETSARVLESRASGRLLLPNSGLRALPPRLGELCPQAIEFSFYSNNRVREPLDVSELPLQLQNLSLSYNNLTAPPSLERLVQLRTVSLGSNRLEEAPAVHMLPLLERLYVHTNNLRRPPDVTRCGQLQVLHLSNNPLIEMPEVRGLVNLRTLMLSNTALTSLPRWIEDLPPTLHIELDNCPLDQETRAFIERLRAERRGPEISHSPPPPPRLDPGAQPLAAQPLAARPTSLAEFEKVAKQAHKLPLPSVSQTVPAKGEELAELVRTLGELNVVAEHASHAQMQREQEVARQAQEHADKVRRSIYSAVDSAVGKQWEDGARKARKGLAPHGSTVIFDPVAAAARASAAGSLSATAPDGMALDLHKALLDSPEGKALLQALERTGQFYDKDKPEHSAFEKLLQAAAAIHVQRTLAPIESSLRRQVQTTVRASLARDIVVQATLQLQRDADAEEATLRVHTKANEPPTSSGGLPSTSGGASQGPSVERARLGTSASLARSEGQGQSQGPATRTPINAAPTVPASPQGAGSSRAEESTLLRAMPSAPNDPLRTARRNQEPASRQ
jgi:hypothetical protein